MTHQCKAAHSKKAEVNVVETKEETNQEDKSKQGIKMPLKKSNKSLENEKGPP